MDRKEKLGIAVKTERLRRNMTQTELSQKAGVSLRTITDVQKYRGNPRYDTMYQLIRYLDLPVTEFFYPEHDSHLINVIAEELSNYSPEDLQVAFSVLTGLYNGLHPEKNKQFQVYNFFMADHYTPGTCEEPVYNMSGICEKN